jgi:hypothetical protein
MRKKIIAASIALVGLLGFAAPSFASERVAAFVCPVIFTENVTHSPKSGELSEGHYTIGGPDIYIPVDATNADGDGEPQGDHSAPGDTDYTAVWAK